MWSGHREKTRSLQERDFRATLISARKNNFWAPLMNLCVKGGEGVYFHSFPWLA